MSGTVTPDPLALPPDPLVPTGLQIVAVTLRELHYNEVGSVDPGKASPEGQDRYEIHGAIDIRPPDLIQVAMKFALKPNHKTRPIHLSCVLSATFRRGKDLDMDAVAEFIRVRSHLILFPYMRELVSNVTGRGVYGALYLHPVVLPPMLERDEMKAYVAGLSPSNSTVVASGPAIKTRVVSRLKKKMSSRGGKAASPEEPSEV
jgi:hypothetical protein